MTIINGCSVSQQCCTLKNPSCSMVISAEHRSKICSRSPAVVTSPKSEKFSSGTKTSYEQINEYILDYNHFIRIDLTLSKKVTSTNFNICLFRWIKTTAGYSRKSEHTGTIHKYMIKQKY